jgi:hypothetical protein
MATAIIPRGTRQPAIRRPVYVLEVRDQAGRRVEHELHETAADARARIRSCTLDLFARGNAAAVRSLALIGGAA